MMRRKTIDTIPVLTKETAKILKSLSKSRSEPASLVKRSQIILMASDGRTNQQIAATINLHYENVATWRTRFLQSQTQLKAIEQSDVDALYDKIVEILSDKQRIGAPSKFTQEQILCIIDLACKQPKEFGYEVSHWSLPLLVKEIQKQAIAEQISAKTVSRFLKYSGSKAT